MGIRRRSISAKRVAAAMIRSTSARIANPSSVK
jgi:hypothetical protein